MKVESKPERLIYHMEEVTRDISSQRTWDLSMEVQEKHLWNIKVEEDKILKAHEVKWKESKWSLGVFPATSSGGGGLS